MNGRTKMMLAQTAARRGRGNDYGNPRDNEVQNNYRRDEMRDRPYYAHERPVNVIVEPMRYDGTGMNMPENNRYTGYNEGGRYVGYNGGNGGNGMEYRGGTYNAYNGQYPPPMYEYPESRRIGFGGNSETKGDRSEMNSRNIFFGGSHHRKHSDGEITKEKAQKWTKHMKNSDGSTGAHWDFAQTKALGEKLGINVDPVEFYVAANMMYSDYCGVAKKFGLDTADFYGHMAKAFLEDKDAGPDKLKNYFEEVVGTEEDDD
jgi:hypothetical protein